MERWKLVVLVVVVVVVVVAGWTQGRTGELSPSLTPTSTTIEADG